MMYPVMLTSSPCALVLH